MPGRRRFGVPAGGAFDQESLALANGLLGNLPDEPALELALGPATFVAEADVSVAVVGAGVSGEARRLLAGEEWILEAPREGCRRYLALPGGVAREGDRLRSRSPRRVPERRLADPPASLRPGPLRVVRGPQADLGFDALVRQAYRVSSAADRMGLRLEGPATPHTRELPSEPAVPGTIQLPPGGQPILLGPDGPTLGGYPKPAVVVSADLDRLGQLRPGDLVTFEEISLDAARSLRALSLARQARRLAELGMGGVGG